MPEVSKEIILEFQQIIKEEYDREVSFTEAADIARNLVGYFDLLAKIKARDRNSE